MRLKLKLKPSWMPVVMTTASALLLSTTLHAADTHSAEERAEDARRHRAMAAAHTAAAQCLEAGKAEQACLQELQAACKGLGIGKYCGMKHVH